MRSKEHPVISVTVSTIMETSDVNAIEKAKTIIKSLKSDLNLTLFDYHAEKVEF